jgi:8-oxo-dGTP pyrophosphatase MutT (NUDIX family)/glyoxylase-like metal-dependent hydrolase (beta-lactamase superfamily II)
VRAVSEWPPPRPAATVVLIRPGSEGGSTGGSEVLLTLRPATMAFAGDMYVFPGGAVDPADADGRLVARSSLSPEEAAAALGGGLPLEDALGRHLAAIRELFEEAGVLLADPDPGHDAAAAARAGLLEGRSTLADVAEALDLRLRTDLLVPVSHWTTPPIMARRFDTRFFAVELPSGVVATFDPGEVAGHRWATPRAALDAMAAGDIAMWVPTGATLQQLVGVGDLTELRARFAHGPVVAPRVIVERPDLRRIVVSGAGGVPGRTVNTYLVGRRELLVVDPGDPSDAAATAILETANDLGARVVAIALTNPEPDHAGGAEGLALRLDIPIFGGPTAGRDLPYEIRDLAGGREIPRVDRRVVASAKIEGSPGHVVFEVGDGDLIIGDLLGAPAGRPSGRLFPGHGEPVGPDAPRAQ